MAIRKFQKMGESPTGSVTIGVSLDKSELREDGLVDEDGDPVDVPVAISREDRGRYVIEALQDS